MSGTVAMTNLLWSFSAHAKDVWTSPAWEKRAKLAACDWAVTCTRIGHEHLKTLTTKGNVSLVYQGPDLDRFTPARRIDGRRDGSAPSDPTQLLSVGRAVKKKGCDDLLSALGALPRDLAWNLVHIGGRPMLNEGAVRVRSDFSLKTCIEPLAAQFGLRHTSAA